MAQPLSNRVAVMNGSPAGSQVRSDMAARALASDAPTTQDNLGVLLGAAAQLTKQESEAASLRSPGSTFNTPSSTGRRGTFGNGMPSIDARLSDGLSVYDAKGDAEHALAVKAWESMRFVRAGWFTAEEAMSYVNFFYLKLGPMTPISPPDFRDPSKHLALLTDEPVLAIAILMIASRHMRLSGHAAVTRAARIHDTLWDYLRCMIERLLWGQEQFGGGFCAAGTTKVRESQSGQLSWKGSLRTLGTIEALLLLTDWQPRALHFPPGDDENRLLDTNYNLLADTNESAIDDHEEMDSRQGRPYGAWLEPTWRSDRMSWMLLGLACALSFELGVFDKNHYDCRHDHDHASSCARKRRVRRMVLVYVSQTSGRMGLPSMLPLPEWSNDQVFEETSKQQSHGQPEDAIDIMQSCWLDIARLMYEANKSIFPTKTYTRNLVATDEYKNKVNEFAPMLKRWKDNFDSVKHTFSSLMKHVLEMEYQYARCYINSLGLQKVVESWVSLPGGESNGTNGEHADHQSKLRDLYIPNRVYIDEVADSALMILKSVVEGIGPGGDLCNAPVRTFLRSISGMMFTLKRFGVGAFEADVRQALDLLDQSTDLMEKDVVDDVHLSSQIAGLIKLLTANIRKTFIRVQGKENGSETASRQETPNQAVSHHGVKHTEDDFQQPARKRPRTTASSRQHQSRDPLEGIQAQPMEDLSNHTFMPPPDFYPPTSMPNGVNANIPNAMDPMFDPMNTDWLTLPLDNLFNSSTAPVDMGFGGIGPTVGDRDMLELITNVEYDQWNMNMPNVNMNFGNGGYAHQQQ